MAEETPVVKEVKVPRVKGQSKKDKAVVALAESAKAVEAGATVVDATPQPRNEDTHDSIDNPKDTSVQLGPRGDESVVHIPAGYKPEPENKPVANTVTDNVDSAGNEITEPHVPGPRGIGAGKTHPDSYRL